MARLMIRKIDRFINYLTLSVIICGGMLIHILTALTIKSYYGSPWGYVSFFLPGLSEIYLVTLQISENMYNYMILLSTFIAVTVTLGFVWFIKNLVKSRVEATIGN
jgi:hypothetical protein